MNTIDELALINLVRKYPLLYDLSSPLYNDQQKKEEAWNEISILTSASAYDCKTKWTRLRDNYRKALIVRNKNSARTKNRAMKYEQQLSFLNEKFFCITPKKRNLEPEREDEEPQVKVLAVETPPPVLLEPMKVKKIVTKKVPIKCSNVRPTHELNSFFESIAETVKTFPKKVQVQLKKEIFDLVNTTEAALVDNKDAVISFYPKDLRKPKFELKHFAEAPSTTNSADDIAVPNNPHLTRTMLDQNYELEIKQEIFD